MYTIYFPNIGGSWGKVVENDEALVDDNYIKDLYVLLMQFAF